MEPNATSKLAVDAAREARDDLVLEVPEVARRLRISRSFAYELIATGALPSIRLGRRVLVPAKLLEEFVMTSAHM